MAIHELMTGKEFWAWVSSKLVVSEIQTIWQKEHAKGTRMYSDILKMLENPMDPSMHLSPEIKQVYEDFILKKYGSK